jgi:hypothetical protein
MIHINFPDTKPRVFITDVHRFVIQDNSGFILFDGMNHMTERVSYPHQTRMSIKYDNIRHNYMVELTGREVYEDVTMKYSGWDDELQGYFAFDTFYNQRLNFRVIKWLSVEYTEEQEQSMTDIKHVTVYPKDYIEEVGDID